MMMDERPTDPRVSPVDTIPVPEWLETADVASWIVDPRGRISFMNERARELLGVHAPLGVPCHELVRTRDEAGFAFCAEDCPLRRERRAGARLAPRVVELECGPEGSLRRRVLFLSFALASTEGRDIGGESVLHCVVEVERCGLALDYLRRVASRSTDATTNESTSARFETLTRREVEILGLLARDLDTYDICRRLHISHATVRNHVQHILEKLGVHTTQEAVARYVLHRGIGGICGGTCE